ncbi:uncharacterized protein METZ01_LOCUS447061 [marine metagenome]|uniref:Uncharacterized protein n=1 Tax=marine metagenome TaxID=408172 RepID=A0A382ZFC0_9ZZZZ
MTGKIYKVTKIDQNNNLIAFMASTEGWRMKFKIFFV